MKLKTIDKLQRENMSSKRIKGYLSPMDLFDGEIKKGTCFIKQIAQGKEVYEPTTGVHPISWANCAFGGGYQLPKEIVEQWEVVYETKEEIVSMGEFNLKVTSDGIFHKNQNITKFVENMTKSSLVAGILVVQNHGETANEHYMADSYRGDVKYDNSGTNYYATIKDVIFSRTGCEHSETKLSQWVEVWNKYQSSKLPKH